jgi:hypothetical protein
MSLRLAGGQDTKDTRGVRAGIKNRVTKSLDQKAKLKRICSVRSYGMTHDNGIK